MEKTANTTEIKQQGYHARENAINKNTRNTPPSLESYIKSKKESQHEVSKIEPEGY